MQIPGFHWQDGDIYFIEEPSCLAYFKYWLSSFNPSLSYWTYFPKDLNEQDFWKTISYKN